MANTANLTTANVEFMGPSVVSAPCRRVVHVQALALIFPCTVAVQLPVSPLVIPKGDSRKPNPPSFGFGTSTRWHRMTPLLKELR